MYPGTAEIFPVPPIISGTGKATNFKFYIFIFNSPVMVAAIKYIFCTHIHRIDRNTSPLQISGKVAVGVVRTLEIFQGTHILGASRGCLCDSSAFLFFLLQQMHTEGYSVDFSCGHT